MRLVPVLLAIAPAVGCTPDYPMDRPGTWSLDQNGSANRANLTAMVANPRDLVRGTGTNTSLGPEAAVPANQFLTGQRQALPPVDSLDVTVVNNPQPATTPTNGGSNGSN